MLTLTCRTHLVQDPRRQLTLLLLAHLARLTAVNLHIYLRTILLQDLVATILPDRHQVNLVEAMVLHQATSDHHLATIRTALHQVTLVPQDRDDFLHHLNNIHLL